MQLACSRSCVSACGKHLASCWRPRQDLVSALGAARRGPGTIAALNGVRALALLWVLAFHAAFLGSLGDLEFPPGKAPPTSPPVPASWTNTWLAQPPLNGDVGVDIFFALSGILIATMWLRETAKKGGGFSYARFISRRYLRLAPMLGVGIAMQIVAAWAYGKDGDVQRVAEVCAREWWQILLMVNNLTPYATRNCLTQSWSVAVEFQLYLLAPLLLLCVWDPKRGEPRRFCWPGMALAWAVTPALKLVLAARFSSFPLQWVFAFNRWGVAELPLSYTAFFSRSSPFVAGMAAALAVQHIKRRAHQAVLPSKAPPSSPPPLLPPAAPTAVDCKVACGDGGRADADADADAGAGAAADGARALPRWRCSAACLVSRAVDVLALGVCVAVVFLGAGENRHTNNVLGPTADIAITILGRPVFGAALAWLLAAVLLGSRCRWLAWVLSLPLWTPAAALSYGAYLLQDVPLVLVPSWTSVGVSTLFAGWSVYLVSWSYFSLLSLAIAVPFHVLVEMPGQRVIKRGY